MTVLAVVVGIAVIAGLAIRYRAKRKLASAVRGRRANVRIDPFTLDDPWRRFVTSTQSTKGRFARQVDTVADGPIKERLQSIRTEVDRVAAECWVVAQEGQRLSNALAVVRTSRVSADLARAEAELAVIEAERSGPLADTVASLQNQQAAGQRLLALEQSTVDRLRQLDASLQELVARAAELSVAGSEPALGDLRSDVENVAIEMEAVRRALEETSKLGGASVTEG